MVPEEDQTRTFRKRCVVFTFVSFLTDTELAIGDKFLREGYVIAPAADRIALDRIRNFIVEQSAKFLDVSIPSDAGLFLESIGDRISPDRLNDLRIYLIDAMLKQSWLREAYFSCGRRALEALVGNELAMQRGFGLSIQLPHDDSSVLPLHSDVWSEDSPFEVVLWIPLVDCYATKSMFLLPPEADAKWRPRMHEFARSGVEQMYHALKSELHWLDVPYGNVLVFTHTLMHGNRVNVEKTARWSMNVRFKSLFTPYSDKQLGDFFEPIIIRPASRIGMTYQLPGGFDER